MSSEYEQSVADLLVKKKKFFDENKEKLTEQQKNILLDDISTLVTLYDNYNLGMNVFRRSMGGRSGLRE